MIATSQGAPTSDNVVSMKSAVAVQPVSVGVDAEGIRFQAYKTYDFLSSAGVWYNPTSGSGSQIRFRSCCSTRVVSLMLHAELTSTTLPLLLDTALMLIPTKNTGS